MTIVGGRYGLSSKDTTPAQIVAVFDSLKADKPKNNFTIRIVDDVTRDFAQVDGRGRITKDIVEAGLSRLEIDSLGLERYDRTILRSVIENFGGGPVGAETLIVPYFLMCKAVCWNI